MDFQTHKKKNWDGDFGTNKNKILQIVQSQNPLLLEGWSSWNFEFPTGIWCRDSSLSLASVWRKILQLCGEWRTQTQNMFGPLKWILIIYLHFSTTLFGLGFARDTINTQQNPQTSKCFLVKSSKHIKYHSMVQSCHNVSRHHFRSCVTISTKLGRNLAWWSLVVWKVKHGTAKKTWNMFGQVYLWKYVWKHKYSISLENCVGKKLTFGNMFWTVHVDKLADMMRILENTNLLRWICVKHLHCVFEILEHNQIDCFFFYILYKHIISAEDLSRAWPVKSLACSQVHCKAKCPTCSAMTCGQRPRRSTWQFSDGWMVQNDQKKNNLMQWKVQVFELGGAWNPLEKPCWIMSRIAVDIQNTLSSVLDRLADLNMSEPC